MTKVKIPFTKKTHFHFIPRYFKGWKLGIPMWQRRWRQLNIGGHLVEVVTDDTSPAPLERSSAIDRMIADLEKRAV
ncbi:hypothetical protein [Eleftheria terrae]|uniref:hypothetical protein n=1 Tax=Eleftheria terrae TaxID=1597781 RepID=UPI00263B0086|nr:hypothetical protein [Eleftheria terrae]WKB55971.1 hypothetical protein N7L95_28275 [Eleftheria terrae]